jgi:hypothetical protein
MRRILSIALCLLALGSSTTQAQWGRRVQIVNRSSSSIEYLHALNTDRQKWEKDLLGPLRMIQPGHYIDADIDDGSWHCRYELQAVLVDGREVVQPDFDVCANISWAVNVPD